jgi:gluconate kinase
MTPDDAPDEVQATWLDPAIMGRPSSGSLPAPPTARPAGASSPRSSRLSSRLALRPDKIGGVALFVISGISAAGKSTVARLLAGRFERGACVHGDAIREMMVSGRADMSPEPGPEALRHLILRYAGALAVTRVFLDGGFDVVVEDVIIGPVLHDFLGLVPVPEVHLVFLDPEAAAIRQREQERDQVAYAPDRWSVSGLQAILREQTDRIGLWLDTTGQTAEQTVEAILSDLDTSRVRLPRR